MDSFENILIFHLGDSPGTFVRVYRYMWQKVNSVTNSIIGADLAERGAQETSSIVVETVQKISKSKQAGPVLPLFKSDASKVTSKGMGLKKAYLGKQNVFTVNASDAGNVLFVQLRHQMYDTIMYKY